MKCSEARYSTASGCMSPRGPEAFFRSFSVWRSSNRSKLGRFDDSELEQSLAEKEPLSGPVHQWSRTADRGGKANNAKSGNKGTEAGAGGWGASGQRKRRAGEDSGASSSVLVKTEQGQRKRRAKEGGGQELPGG